MKKIIVFLTAAVMLATPAMAKSGCERKYCRSDFCRKMPISVKTAVSENMPETLRELYEKLLEKYGIKFDRENGADFEKDAAQAGNGWMNVPQNNVDTWDAKQTSEPEPEKPHEQASENAAEPEKPEENYVNEQKNDSSYEMQVLNLVNEQRRKNGVGELTYSYELEAVGKAHSEDMLKNHYFSHNSLDGKTPFDRMRAAGISFGYAAENIAAGQQGPAGVMNSWMNSEGHRKNILNPNYKKMGVGIAYGGGYGIYWTQEFTD